ncbi:RNA polymerase sigma factor [Tundrisphaera lichenicola]|uniref:RNA polymerase sigma factor n=1 Tax=Tundrisphaera lichenicola TaxID=2029860 RepID=UPI003EB739E9
MSGQGFVDGDELAAIVPLLRSRAQRLIGKRLGQWVAPSDLVQETLLIAVRRFAEISGRPARQVLAWLLQTMQFRLMRYVRDHRDELVRPERDCGSRDEGARSSTAVLGRMVRSEVGGILFAQIETLPEAERRVVEILYRENRTTTEVAAELGRSEGAVRALHQRALRRLRVRFGVDRP